MKGACKMKVTKKEARKAYLTLIQAIHEKPVANTPTARRYDKSAQYLRALQDISVHLSIAC